MESTALQAHRPVGLAGAFVRQFRLLWTSRRPLLLLVALLGGLLLSGEPWVDDPKARLLTLWPIWLALIGPFWAFAVFHNEGPADRLYHWSQPVSRPVHSGARLAAGLAWLWLIFALFLLTGWLAAVVDGEAWQLAEIGAGGWLNFFTGPLIGYLAVSILTVPSDYPIRWFFGILFLFPLTMKILGDWLGLAWLADTIVEPLNNQDWGLGITLVGGLNEDINRLEQTLRAMVNPGFQRRSVELAADWWLATPVWIVLLAAIVAFVTALHPDVLPRLRRR